MRYEAKMAIGAIILAGATFETGRIIESALMDASLAQPRTEQYQNNSGFEAARTIIRRETDNKMNELFPVTLAAGVASLILATAKRK